MKCILQSPEMCLPQNYKGYPRVYKINEEKEFLAHYEQNPNQIYDCKPVIGAPDWWDFDFGNGNTSIWHSQWLIFLPEEEI